MVYPPELQRLIYKYSNIGLFVDTEPLLVYIVGKYKPSKLKDIGSQYNEEDYKIIESFLCKFNRIIITPYIIAEISNLMGKKLKSSFKELIIGCTFVLKNYYEQRLKKELVVNRKEAQWLGFPDVSIIISSERKRALVLAKDGNLLRTCENLGINCINFDSLRTMDVD